MPRPHHRASSGSVPIPDAAWSLVGVAGGPLVGLVVAALALRVTDAGAYGTYSVAMSLVVTGAVFASLGMQRRAIPWLGGVDPDAEQHQVLVRIQLGQAASGLVTGLLIAVLLSFAQALGHLQEFPLGIWWLLAIGCMAQTALVFGREVRRGLGRIRSASLLGPVTIGTLTVGALVLLATTKSPADGRCLVAIGVGSTTVLAIISGAGLIWKQPRRPNLSRVLGDMRSWFKPSLPFASVGVLQVIDAQVGLWIVALLAVDSGEIGIMAVGVKLGQGFGLPSGIVAYVSSHHIARQATGPRNAALAERLRRPILLSAAMTGLGLAIALLVGVPVVSWLLGAEVTDGVSIAIIFGLGFLVVSLAGPANQVLLYNGESRLALIAPTVSVVLTAGLGWAGMATVGPKAVAAAVSLAWLVRAAIDTTLMHRVLGWSFVSSLLARRPE